jgi:hypothetical protein
MILAPGLERTLGFASLEGLESEKAHHTIIVGKRKYIAHTEPHENTRSLIDGRKACG